MSQETADPDGEVTVLRDDKVEEREEQSSDELETWVLEGDRMEDMIRRVIELPRSQWPIWWDAVCVNPSWADEVTLVRISPDQPGRIRKDQLFDNFVTHQVSYEESMNIDDVDLMLQSLGILDDSPEYARRM